MHMTDAERPFWDAEDERFRLAHPVCRSMHWTVAPGGPEHCASCCPPPPMSPETLERVARLLRPVLLEANAPATKPTQPKTTSAPAATKPPADQTLADRTADWAAIVASVPDTELPLVWTLVMSELGRRGIIRTANNPVADMGEFLACEILGLTLAGGVTQGFDATDADGRRYQIKSHRRLKAGSTAKKLGVIRKIEQREFEFVIGMIFNHDLSIGEVWRLPYEAVVEHSTYVATLNGHRLRAGIWSDPRSGRVEH
jgi:hypothetical protein